MAMSEYVGIVYKALHEKSTCFAYTYELHTTASCRTTTPDSALESIGGLEGLVRLLAGLQTLNDGMEEALNQSLGEEQKTKPTDQKLLGALPYIQLDKVHVEDGHGETVCSICQENNTVGELAMELPCSHHFHPVIRTVMVQSLFIEVQLNQYFFSYNNKFLHCCTW